MYLYDICIICVKENMFLVVSACQTVSKYTQVMFTYINYIWMNIEYVSFESHNPLGRLPNKIMKIKTPFALHAVTYQLCLRDQKLSTAAVWPVSFAKVLFKTAQGPSIQRLLERTVSFLYMVSCAACILIMLTFTNR